MDDTLSIERAAVLLGMTRAEVILLILARSLPAYLEGNSGKSRHCAGDVRDECGSGSWWEGPNRSRLAARI
jgi:hypothetical protein